MSFEVTSSFSAMADSIAVNFWLCLSVCVCLQPVCVHLCACVIKRYWANIYWVITLCQVLFKALYIYSINSLHHYNKELKCIIIYILHIGKLRHREVELLAKGHRQVTAEPGLKHRRSGTPAWVFNQTSVPKEILRFFFWFIFPK